MCVFLNTSFRMANIEATNKQEIMDKADMSERVEFGIMALRNWKQASSLLTQIETQRKWIYVPGDECMFDSFVIEYKIGDSFKLLCEPEGPTISMRLQEAKRYATME